MNLIYQNWTGTLTTEVKNSVKQFKQYASSIGVDYRFDENPNIASKLCKEPFYYECFNHFFDKKFDAYENILVVDTDVFVNINNNQNIFEEIISDIGICLENHQSELRKKSTSKINTKNDERWMKIIKKAYDVDLPRTKKGDMKIYNSGVVLWSRQGIEKAKKLFSPFQEYINVTKSVQLPTFYTLDQMYLHAMMYVAKLQISELDNKWNSFCIHVRDKNNNIILQDYRTESTVFVHNQMKNTDNLKETDYIDLASKSNNEWTFLNDL